MASSGCEEFQVSESAIQIEMKGAVAWVWLNRPDVHNAFDAALIAELTAAYNDLAQQADVRAIVLAGRGKSFSAGADVQWMKQQGAASVEDNTSDARKLADLFHAIASCPKPTLARVHGAAIGGGVGLTAVCDIAIGSGTAIFAMSEVRLGLIPATIAPYVVRAIGERHARRLFQTAERIDAATAQRIGLLHEAVPVEELDARIGAVLEAILAGAPEAQNAAKALVANVAGLPIDAELREETARLIALLRGKPEAAEGLSAFLEKRPASWVPRGS
jgi:methylglutaconyl-CoA hydratase